MNKLKTCIIPKHNTFLEHPNYQDITDIPYWLQLIHGDNIFNLIRGSGIYLKKLQDFGLNIELQKEGYFKRARRIKSQTFFIKVKRKLGWR